MKKIIHILIFVLVPLVWLNCYTQNNISSEWMINSMGNKWDVVSDQVIDCNGNLYLAGNFTSDIEIGENSEKLIGGISCYISKVTGDGDVDWLKQISASRFCIINSISIDSTGSVYLCGNFKGEINLDGIQLILNSKKNAYIFKFDNKGDAQWGKQIDGVFLNKNVFISCDNQYHLFFTGSFSGELVTEDHTYRSKNFTDILIMKLNPNGEILHEMTISGKSDDLVNNITTDQNNQVLLTGSFEKELIISNQELKSKGKKDAFLLRLDNDLHFMNIYQFGGVYDDYGKNLTVDINNNLILTGSFTNEVHINKDHVLKSNGRLDVFLIKFDNTGEVSWSKNFGGAANDYISSISINSIGNIYLIGNYRGQISTEDKKIESKEFSNDIFLTKYDSHGNFRFMETIGHGNHEFGRNLCIGADDYIYLSGNYSRILDVFENESKPSESEEFFLTKLYDCENANKVQLPRDTVICAEQFIINARDDFDQYFWNGQSGNNKLDIDSTGTYIVEAINEHGCISFDIIIVELNKPPEINLGDTLIVQQGETVSLKAPDGMQEYLWSDNSTLSFLNINTYLLEPGMYNYSVKVKDENNCSESDNILLTVLDKSFTTEELAPIDYIGDKMHTDIKNENNDSNFIVTIYPNPVKDLFHINIPSLIPHFNLILQILTGESEEVWRKNILIKEKYFENILDISNFKPGVYILKVNYNTYEQTFKIIKL